MRLGVFVSEWREENRRIWERLKAEKIGVFLVANGVYYAVINEKNKMPALIERQEVDYYVLTEDLQTRGFSSADVASQIKIVTYSDIVDLIMNDYQKLIWL